MHKDLLDLLTDGHPMYLVTHLLHAPHRWMQSGTFSGKDALQIYKENIFHTHVFQQMESTDKFKSIGDVYLWWKVTYSY